MIDRSRQDHVRAVAHVYLNGSVGHVTHHVLAGYTVINAGLYTWTKNMSVGSDHIQLG